MISTDALRGYASTNGLKRAAIPLTAGLLGILALLLTFLSSAWWLILLAIAVAILALGMHDMLQARSALLANYPVATRFRWLALDLRPFFRAYMVEDDEEGKPYSYEARRLVYQRAERGSSTHPFGTELDVYSGEHVWVGHSMAPSGETDRDPRVRIGSSQAGRPYDASVFNISAMSFGALSANAIEALNFGAKRGGYYHDTGEGGISPYHLKHGGDLVWELGSGYFGARDEKGRFDPELFAEQSRRDSVRMTEIKLSQGAKPGHGGLLPGAKVTQEIADTRKVPVHQDCLSPRGHSAFGTPVEMLEFAANMRELSGGKPVGIKFCVGQPHEVMAVMKAMRETGILLDFIVVDGAEGGTGAAPLELSNHVGMPLLDGLIVVRNALVGSGLHGQVKLAASGKLHSGTGLAECLAIGADWGNAARAFLFSIGCIQAQRCHTGTCPTGITTQDPARMRGLDPEIQGHRAANFQGATVEALMEIVAAAGLEHPSDLRPHHIHHRISASKSLPLDHIWEFLPENALLDAPQETAYAPWWKAADPHSFRPRIKLDVARRHAPRTSEPDY